MQQPVKERDFRPLTSIPLPSPASPFYLTVFADSRMVARPVGPTGSCIAAFSTLMNLMNLQATKIRRQKKGAIRAVTNYMKSAVLTVRPSERGMKSGAAIGFFTTPPTLNTASYGRDIWRIPPETDE